MPYIEHTAELTLFGEAVEVPLWIQYERHERIGEAYEPGGLAISPAEPEHCEIQGISIILIYAKIFEYEMKTEPADWLLKFMTADQRGEIENAILEELE